jgi:hypothetical protein
MPILNVVLQQTERDALSELAKRERRNVKAQAAVIIRRELERAGLLPTATTPAAAQPITTQAAGVQYGDK